MSEGFVFHSTGRRHEQREKILGRVLWIIIICLFVLALVKLLFQFVITPGVRIKQVEIESEVELPEEQVLRIAGIEKNKYYFSLDLKEIEKSLEAVVQVREAVVEKVFPDTLKIILSGRTPVALALAGNEKISIPVAFDEDGIIIRVGRQIDNWDLPVISGLKFNNFEAGTKLPKPLLSFVKEIRMLKESYAEIYALISEIKIEPVGSLDYELVLYLLPFTTAVRLGPRLQGEQLGYAMMVLDVLDKQDAAGQISEIDFRTNEVVYKQEGGLIN